MTTDFFIKGCIIGFSVAAPVGPIGVLTIKRTLTEGRLSGFLTGLGAALADALYGAVVGFGLTGISGFLSAQSGWLKLAGGLFLLYLGVRSVLSKPSTKEANAKGKSLFSNFIGTFFLTVTNPATIFSFLAIFAGLGLGTMQSSYTSSTILVAGVFTGSAAWWLILSGAIGFFSSKITPVHLVWINRLSGVLIILFAVWTLYSGFVSWNKPG